MKIMVINKCFECPFNKREMCKLSDNVKTEYYPPKGCPLHKNAILVTIQNNIIEE